MKTSPLHALVAASACVSMLLATAPAHAATAEDDRTPLNLAPAEPVKEAAAAGGGSGGGFARMIVGLLVVIAVIYGLSWVLKQVRAAKEGQATGGGLSAISTLPLGPNRSVHLVRVGHDLVLLGVAEKGVTPIRTYGEDEARAAGLLGDHAQLESGIALGGNGDANGAVKAGNLVSALRKATVRR